MRFDRIDIEAAPDAIWPYVADPVLMSTWNPKIVAVDRAREGVVEVGERYDMIFRMTSSDTECRVEVLEIDSPRAICYRQQYEANGRTCHVDESFTLAERGDSTRVTHDVDLRHSGIPLVFRALIFVIMRIGRPMGEPYLAVLKRTVER